MRPDLPHFVDRPSHKDWQVPLRGAHVDGELGELVCEHPEVLRRLLLIRWLPLTNPRIPARECGSNCTMWPG